MKILTRALALVWAFGMAATAGAGTVELISRAEPVPDSFGVSGRPSFSADGRYVVFLSTAANLAPGQVDDNRFLDVFLHDRTAGTTTLVSHEPDAPATASPAGGFYFSVDAGISADGRYVVYTSLGTRLAPGVTDGNERTDVFLWDRVADTTTLVSHAAGAPDVTADGLSYGARVSADGNQVVFLSHANNLVAGQTEPTGGPSTTDVFLWSRASGAVTLVSRKGGAATAAAKYSDEAGISADGRFVVFTSQATDLVPGLSDTNGTSDVFVYQRSNGAVSLVSRASGAPLRVSNNSSSGPRISADGRFIAFSSHGSDLVPGQVDGFTQDAFLYDRTTGAMRLASRTSASPGTAGGIVNFAGPLALSADGRFLVFTSLAPNLVPGQVDTNGLPDVFVYDRVSGATALASRARSGAARATAQRAAAWFPSVSADGRYVAFQSSATDLVAGQTDTPETFDVFLYDTATKKTVLVSRAGASPATAANAPAELPVVSPDGSAVAFNSTATNLGDGQFDPNGFDDLFLYSRASAEVSPLSRPDPGIPPATPYGPSTLGGMSADGQVVVFLSRATGLIPGQIDEPYGLNGLGQEKGTWDAFLRDRATGKTVLLSRSDASPREAAGLLAAPVLSADGRYAVFSRLVRPAAGSEAWSYRLYLYDRIADSAVLVNHLPGAPSEPTSGFLGDGFAVSADGRYVAYDCSGCFLVPGQQSGRGDELTPDVFLYDRVTGDNTLVSHAHGAPATGGNSSSRDLHLSADGRFVVFVSEATNLAAGQTGVPGVRNVFVFDRTTGAVTLASHAAGSPATGGSSHSSAPVISADGRFIAYRSFATDLVPGQADANGKNDVFLHDRAAGTTTLLSYAAGSPATTGNGESAIFDLEREISISADGRFVVFTSLATDLVPGGTDTNGAIDLFLYDRTAAARTLVNHAHGAPGTPSNQGAVRGRISADGHRIAFTSAATDLAPGLAGGGDTARLFLQDRATGSRTLVGPMHPARFFRGDSPVSLFPRLSGDGCFVAFTSDSSLVPGDHNASWDVFLYDDAGSGGGTVPVPPCTLFDTRRPADGPALRSGVRKTLPVHGACGVPATATEVLVKVTVPRPRRRGSLSLFPGNVAAPAAATLRFPKGPTRSGTFTVPLGAGALALQPTVTGNGTIHINVEVVGYVE